VNAGGTFYYSNLVNGTNTIAICTGGNNSTVTIYNNNFGGSNPSGATYTYSLNNGPSTPITNSATLNINYGNNTFILTATSGTCSFPITTIIYSGSNPFVALGASSRTGLCLGNSVNFTINPVPQSPPLNPPGTSYTLTFSDNPGQTVSYTDLTSPTVVNHVYNLTSCGIINTGTPFPNNAFYATVTAQNPCGQTQSFYSPITVSNSPTANFTVSDSTICSSQTITVTNTGLSGSVVGTA
jgi:hypothetical protein